MVSIRTSKLEIIDRAMESDPLSNPVFVKEGQYFNAWKKWTGEILGLEKMNTIGKKQNLKQDSSTG